MSFTQSLLLFGRNLKKEGLYHTPLYRKLLHLSLLLLLAIGGFLSLSHGGFLLPVGICAMAIFYPQAAFLGHDIAHGQWVGRTHPAYVPLGILSGFLQAFTLSWWNAKHDLHHLYPNGVRQGDGRKEAVDDDIDTAPWLVWDANLINREQKEKYRGWFRYQRFAMPFLLTFSRFRWSYQSLLFSLNRRLYAEVLALLAHWILFLALSFSLADSPVTALWWFLASQMAGGFVLGFIFILNHFGMPLVDLSERLNFYERQIKATRNTPTNVFLDWFCGGLNSQIEHHLYPKLPSCQLSLIRSQCRDIFGQHGHAYTETSNGKAFVAAWNALKNAGER